MTIRNLTPHPVILIGYCGPDEMIAVYPPEPEAARVTEQKYVSRYETFFLRGAAGRLEPVQICINNIVYGKVEGLPEPEPNTLYIVSRLVKQQIPDRHDCVVPDNIVRDDKGEIRGCLGFAL